MCQRAFDDGCEEHILIPCVDKVVFSRAWSSLPSTLQIFRIGDKDSIGKVLTLSLLPATFVIC